MSNHSMVYSKPTYLKYFKKNLPYAAVFAVLIGVSFLYHPLFLLPLALSLGGIVNFNISYFQKLKKRKIWLTAFAISMAFGEATSDLLPAQAAFSFLFQNTETVFNNCVFKDFSTVQDISSILFGGLRVAFMVGIGIAGYQIWQRRQSGQDFQDVLNILISAILIVVVLGFVEPFIVGPGTC